MGTSSSQTTRTEPPKWQRPYIEYGLGQARDLYGQQQGTAAAWAPAQAEGMLGIANTARNNQLSGNASNLANQTLSGGFLGSNPYLDQTFNQAALATQNQLASQFGRAGRNVEASEGLRSQQLNELATNIYGGNYQAERDRQQQTLGMSPGLNASQYQDSERLAGLGQMQGNVLDQYLGRVNGNMGQSTTQSGGGNPWAAGLGALMTAAPFFMMSDKRTKTDIEKVGKQDGLNVYDYRYKADPTGTRHRGFMAQEVEKKYPDAVAEDKDGIKYVNYGRIGFLGSVT